VAEGLENWRLILQAARALTSAEQTPYLFRRTTAISPVYACF
jgi:hypothetical protein